MALQIDTRNKYFRFGILWALLALIAFGILYYLNQWLETNLWALAFIAVGVTGFLTGWLFRNVY